MKKIFIAWILIVICLQPGNVHAQRFARRDPQVRGAVMERVQEAKWAFIIYKLGLDEKRANALLPVYNAYEAEKKTIVRGNLRQALTDDRDMSDEEAQQLMDAKLESARKLLDLKEKYKSQFLKVLTPSELLELQRAEVAFALKIQAERQRRRQNR